MKGNDYHTSLFYGATMAGESLLTDIAPGHKNLAVIFWAHYMPHIPCGSVQTHPHFRGTTDLWPLLTTQVGTDTEQIKQQILTALGSEINGFEMLAYPASGMYDAARQVFAEAGQFLYVAPESSGNMGEDDLKKSPPLLGISRCIIKMIRMWLKLTGSNLTFFYSPGAWGKKYGVTKIKYLLKKRGTDVMLLPTIFLR
jgi:hypothetical protein